MSRVPGSCARQGLANRADGLLEEEDGFNDSVGPGRSSLRPHVMNKLPWKALEQTVTSTPRGPYFSFIRLTLKREGVIPGCRHDEPPVF